MIALIAAMGHNRVIGANGSMPWHLPADLKHFRRLTRGHAVVMGRKTYESIGKPLKGRTNIILSRKADLTIEGCHVAHSVSEAMAFAQDLFVVGGAELYREFLPHADVLYLTRVDGAFEGDTFFPEFPAEEWELVSVSHHPRDEKNAYDLSFECYHRKPDGGR